MSFDDLNSLLPLALACIMAIGWLFRLEAKAGGKADASAVQQLEAQVAALKAEAGALRSRADVQDAAIKAALDGHNSTTIEVVRLQEQIKHLTEVIERLLSRDEHGQGPAPRPPRRRSPGPA